MNKRRDLNQRRDLNERRNRDPKGLTVRLEHPKGRELGCWVGARGTDTP